MLFPTQERTPALLVVPLIWLVRWVANRVPLTLDGKEQVAGDMEPLIPVTPLNGSILLLMSMVLVSTWATYDLRVSLPKISGMVLAVGTYFAVVREARGKVGWWRVLGVFFVCGLGVALIGLLGTRWSTTKIPFFTPLIERFPMLISGLQGAETGIHPNEVGGALTWVLPLMWTLSVFLIFSRRFSGGQNGESPFSWAVGWLAASRMVAGWGLRISLWLATIIVTGVFILAQSRTSYLGLLMTGLVMGFAVLAILRRWLVLGSTLSAAVVAGISLWIMEIPQRWLNQWRVGMSGEGILSLNSIDGRIVIWSRAIYGIQDFSFTGMGMNTFREVVNILYPITVMAPGEDIGHAHNEFLQTGLDLGIPGLIAFISLYIGAFITLGFVGFRDRNIQPPTRFIQLAVLLGLGGSLLAHMVYGLVDAVALGAKPGILFWILLGLIAGLPDQPGTSPELKPLLSETGEA
jgi:putative inorganic carbon (HCO3(-)) transporter